MKITSSLALFFLASHFQMIAGPVAAGSGQDRPTVTAVQKSAGCELAFSLQSDRYLAETSHDGFKVTLEKQKSAGSIYRYVPDYSFTHGCVDLIVKPFAGGPTFVAWKWCEGHFCPVRNGAVMFNPLTRQVFRLEFEEGKGLAISKSLADPENKEFRVWFLKWWAAWPGQYVREEEIRYKNFDK
jgi:hypothetical protein